MGLLHAIVTYGIGFLVLAMIIRVVCSWLRVSESNQFLRALAFFTDWMVVPIRKVIPPLAGIDFSFIIAFVLLQLIIEPLLLQAIPPGW
jgi:YggT family protein